MILHITTREQWDEALRMGTYRHQSLQVEGFIHCSDPNQILRTANEYFAGQSALVLLCISPGSLVAPLVYEDTTNKGEAFPHLYGPLNLDAVSHVFEFSAGSDGSFTLPPHFSAICRA